MRVHIMTTKNEEVVPYNYQHKLTGTLHKWLGENELHGKPALYSFSWLRGAKSNSDGLNFSDGARLFISFYDDKYLKKVVHSILQDSSMFHGMRVIDVLVEPEPDLLTRNRFMCGSPIFIRRFENEKDIHYTFEDENSGDFLRETLLHKMELAGLHPDETLKIQFENSSNRRIKLIDYKGIKNRVNQCPVIIEGKPETKLFAWNVGLGNSTGIGFGAIY